MKMKIAIPVNESGNLDSHFGHCRYFAIHETDNLQIISEEIVEPPPHEPGVLPKWLAEKEVTHVIAGGMGNRANKIFKRYNIDVQIGAPVMQAGELVNGFLNNTLQFSQNHCNH